VVTGSQKKKGSVVNAYTLSHIRALHGLMASDKGKQCARVSDIQRVMKQTTTAPHVPVAAMEQYLLLLGWKHKWYTEDVADTTVTDRLGAARGGRDSEVYTPDMLRQVMMIPVP
jgi:hypothetical protein